MTHRKDEKDAVRATGYKYLLLSYALNGHKSVKELADSLGFRPTVMVDPGAITFENSNISTGLLDIIDFFVGDGYTPKETADMLLKEVGWMFRLPKKEFKYLNPTKFHRYIRWLFFNIHYIDHVLAFDRIGDPFTSKYMYQVMKHMGLKPVPVFHYNSDFKYLDYYVKEGCPLIALGGSIYEKSYKKRAKWAAECVKRYPNQKFHLLGTQRKYILDRVPTLYSADGNHWKTTASMEENRRPGQSKVEMMIELIDELKVYSA